MKIHSKDVRIGDLVGGYSDKAEEGVRGYGGKLNIRPAFQREFIYNEKQRNEVIHTVRRAFPLNTMYWVVAFDGFELMDGQQRTVSICQYVHGDFAVDFDGAPMFFDNLTAERKKQILDYELSVYVCEGDEAEKLDWFKIINIASLKLTDQELRNAIYTGPWLTDAKRWFSRPGSPAQKIGEKYLTGSPIRQDYLEKALGWFSGDKIEAYMSAHQHDEDAQELWQHFQAVINWVGCIFPTYRALMKGLDWGEFYSKHMGDHLNAAKLEKRILELIEDDEATNKRGIYPYLLTGEERTLNLRDFDEKTKARRYEQQEGKCPMCKHGEHYTLDQMEADHIVPWSKDGKTTFENCQMLCKKHNRTKAGK